MNSGLQLLFFTLISLAALGVPALLLINAYRKRLANMQLKLLEIENSKNNELKKVILETQLEERSKIASNLHDSIGAELSILKLKLSKHSYYLRNNLFIKSDNFDKDIHQLDEAIKHVRSFCRELHSEVLENKGLIYACAEFAEKLNDSESIKCHFKSSLCEEQLFLNKENKSTFFMIYLELANNIIKHSTCTFLEISLSVNPLNELNLVLKHNGVKFENTDFEKQKHLNTGIGLSCLSTRAKTLNAKINYLWEDNASFVIFTCPYDKPRGNHKMSLIPFDMRRRYKRMKKVNPHI